MMNGFEKRYFKLLNEDELDDLIDKLGTDEGETAMADTLDSGTEVSDFDPEDTGRQVEELSNKNRQYMTDTLKKWITKNEEFIQHLNGTENSMQTILHKAKPDTLFDKISTSETKKISRVAMELSSLNEMLKGYLVTANDPKLRYV